MTPEDFAKLTLEMLNQQQRYFKTRSHDDLLKSKKIEREVKEAAQEIVRKQRELSL